MSPKESLYYKGLSLYWKSLQANNNTFDDTDREICKGRAITYLIKSLE